MSGLFIEILNMSFSASCVALIVMLIRLALRKAPKIYSYALWAVVFFRLICPFTIQLPVSAVPSQPQTIPYDIVYFESPSIQSGVPVVDNAVNTAIERSLPSATPTNSVNPVQVVLEIGTYLWLAGVLALLLYGIISYLRLKKRVMTAIASMTIFMKPILSKRRSCWDSSTPRYIFPQDLVKKRWNTL